MAEYERGPERDLDDWFLEPEPLAQDWPLPPRERRDEAAPSPRRKRAGTFGDHRAAAAAGLLGICLLIGLAAGGVFGGRTHRQTASAASAAPAARQTPSSASAAPFSPPQPRPAATTLKRGAHGPRVKAVQRALARLGYYSGRIDGQYGPGTERAVTRFQGASGLTPDGILGPKTLRALKKALKR